MSLVGTLVRGAVAGAVGTLAMDALWYRRYREGGGEGSFTEWEFTEASSIGEAGAPAQVADTVTDAVGVEVTDEHAGTVTDAVHWATGMANGVGHALVNGERNPVLGGVLTGAGAFANSYGILGALGIYEPAWEYEPETLRKDLGAHLVYGLTTGLAYAALSSTNGTDEDG